MDTNSGCPKKKYYITTAIVYTSQKPHIGNSYEIVLTDAITRFRRMQGYDVFFLTGTDEHGQKIEDKARAAGVSPKEYVDRVAGEIRAICDLFNTSYDKFIRTTDDYHEKAVQKIFKKLYEQGDIYKGEYSGHYCVPCESFFTDSQLVDGKCPDCGREVNQTSEEAYFLRLSNYQQRLEDYIEQNPDFIYPESRKKEMLNNFIKPGLQDLCVSRTSFKWGVPVDFDPGHVVYVWIDALSNYITALGYSPDGSGELYQKYWPADAHIIGKDIIRFHTIYWPIMLMALGEPLPKQVYGHPWVLMSGDKMSKSTGNVIYADDLIDRFGVDAIRYYLLSEIPFAQDGSLTYETIIERFNSDLANTLGNLVNRSVAMVNKYFGGSLVCSTASGEFDDELKSVVLACLPEVEKQLDAFHMSDAMEAIMNVAKRSNKYIDETAPWALAKDEAQKDRLATVLYNLIESIRFIAVLLKPFMPQTADEILRQINSDLNSFESLETFGAIPVGASVGQASPLFVRIEAEKLLAEIQAELEAKKQPAEKADVPGVAQIGIDDFGKVDLRVATITACEPIKKAKKLLKLTLDDGSGTPRTVASGIALWYAPEDLIGKSVIIVANLKPAVLCGVESQGMILAADCAENDVKVIFVENMPAGAKVR
ncbi:MAG: methionine--tRNA ligase [Oscillospiraceae bacterium]|nr:methionine--tRNA ligase [Oscillospiraceae bacterium]